MTDFVTVNLPDGTQARFPSSMSQEDIQATLQKQFGTPQSADMSFLGRLKDNVIGVDDGVMSTGERFGSLVNKGVESSTLGLVGDELDAVAAGLLPGGRTAEERLEFLRENERTIERENPILSSTAEIGGGVAGAFLPLGALGQLARGGIAARAAASGAAGAGMGGLYGFMEGEGEDRAESAQTGAMWGAGAGLAAPVLGGLVKRLYDTSVQRGPIRQALSRVGSAEQQRQGSRSAYSAFENADAQVTPDALSRLRRDVARRIDNSGAPNIPGPLGRTPASGRQINQTLGAMDNEVQAAISQNPAVPLRAVEDVRKSAGKLAREVDNIGRPTHGAHIAQQAIGEIDNFVENLSPADVPVGDYNAAVSALKKARSMWQQARKTQVLEDISDRADTYLGGMQSGLRNQVKSLLRQNKKTKMFSKQEEAALKKVIGNTALGRSVRLLGDGLGAKLATLGGGATGGLAGAAIGRGASELASEIGDSMAVRNMERAKAIVSSGGLANLPEMSAIQRALIERLTRRGGVALSQ